MELEDFFSEGKSFKLKSTGKTYELRLPNLSDGAFIKSTYGDAIGFQSALEGMDWPLIILFIYRLLNDKSDFLAEDIEEINDTGEKVTRRVTGPEKLLKSISGQAEGLKILSALTQAIAESNPDAKKAMDEEIKKNKKMLQKLGGKK